MTRTIRGTIHASGQMEIDWEGPAPVVAFDERLVRANSFVGRLARAISVTLDDSPLSRSDVAERMGAHLGVKVSLNMLNAYASVARDGHQISVPRFEALLAATGDRRLAQMMVADHGWAVIDRRHLPLIEMGIIAEQKQILAARERAVRAQARGGMR